MTATELGTLTRLVQEAGPGRGYIPVHVLDTLHDSIVTDESAPVRTLHGWPAGDAQERFAPPPSSADSSISATH